MIKRIVRVMVLLALTALVGGVVGCALGSSPTSTTISITTTTTTEAPASWRQVQPSGEKASARCYQSVVYDSVSQRVLMFAGFDGTDALSETWAYDAAAESWTDLRPESEDQPAATRQMPAAYDPTNDRVISFDGSSWGYEVAANVWYLLSPKGDKLTPARVGASMVRDEQSGKMILYGGTDMDKAFDETWSYDPVANTWTNLEPAGPIPPGRSDAGMAYDPVSGTVILFGGVDGEFNCLADTWAYDPESNAWSKLQTTVAPDARSGIGMAYDPHSERIILFGGVDSQLVCYSDTWAFDAGSGTWTQLSPPGEIPMARGRAALVYAADIDMLVLFGGLAMQSDGQGGFGSQVYLDDLWIFGVQKERTSPVPTTIEPPSMDGTTSSTLGS